MGLLSEDDDSETKTAEANEIILEIHGTSYEPVRCTLAEFLSDNETLTDEEIQEISALSIGEKYESGGGASEEWAVVRVANQ